MPYAITNLTIVILLLSIALTGIILGILGILIDIRCRSKKALFKCHVCTSCSSTTAPAADVEKQRQPPQNMTSLGVKHAKRDSPPPRVDSVVICHSAFAPFSPTSDKQNHITNRPSFVVMPPEQYNTFLETTRMTIQPSSRRLTFLPPPKKSLKPLKRQKHLDPPPVHRSSSIYSTRPVTQWPFDGPSESSSSCSPSIDSEVAFIERTYLSCAAPQCETCTNATSAKALRLPPTHSDTDDMLLEVGSVRESRVTLWPSALSVVEAKKRVKVVKIEWPVTPRFERTYLGDDGKARNVGHMPWRSEGWI